MRVTSMGLADSLIDLAAATTAPPPPGSATGTVKQIPVRYYRDQTCFLYGTVVARVKVNLLKVPLFRLRICIGSGNRVQWPSESRSEPIQNTDPDFGT